MGELVAWGLGLALGYSMRGAVRTRRGLLTTIAAVIVVGSLVTLAAGELWGEPWLILVDIGQVAVATLLGVYVLPGLLMQLKRITRTP